MKRILRAKISSGLFCIVLMLLANKCLIVEVLPGAVVVKALMVVVPLVSAKRILRPGIVSLGLILLFISLDLLSTAIGVMAGGCGLPGADPIKGLLGHLLTFYLPLLVVLTLPTSGRGSIGTIKNVIILLSVVYTIQSITFLLLHAVGLQAPHVSIWLERLGEMRNFSIVGFIPINYESGGVGYRPSSFFTESNYLALFMVPSLCYTCRSESWKLHTLLLLGFVMTGSVTTILAYFVIFLLTQAKRGILALAGAVSVAVYLATSYTYLAEIVLGSNQSDLPDVFNSLFGKRLVSANVKLGALDFLGEQQLSICGPLYLGDVNVYLNTLGVSSAGLLFQMNLQYGVIALAFLAAVPALFFFNVKYDSESATALLAVLLASLFQESPFTYLNAILFGIMIWEISVRRIVLPFRS